MTKSDRIYIFDCGNEILNHKADLNGKHKCPDCGSKIKNIIVCCADCGVELLLTTRSAKKKRCAECARLERNKKSRENNSKKEIRLELAGTSSYDQYIDDHMRLETIAVVLPKLVALNKINSKLDKIESQIDIDPLKTISELYKITAELEKAESAGCTRENIRQGCVKGISRFKKNWQMSHPDLPNPTMPNITNRKQHDLNAA
jgi:hypothetical protein